jgi:hypothetical protein
MKEIIMAQYDRFNLETEIFNVWHTKEDLEAITERFLDAPDGPMTEDEIGNLLVGLGALHDIRCRKLFLIFETMLQENCFNDKVVGLSALHDGPHRPLADEIRTSGADQPAGGTDR